MIQTDHNTGAAAGGNFYIFPSYFQHALSADPARFALFMKTTHACPYRESDA